MMEYKDIEGSGGGKSNSGGGINEAPDRLITNEKVDAIHLLGEGVVDLYTNATSVNAFPGSPTTGQYVWRYDLQQAYQYNGSAWVTTTDFLFMPNTGQQIFLNNVPIGTYPNTSNVVAGNFGDTHFDYRSGLSSQTVLNTTLYPSASNVVSVGTQVYGGTTSPYTPEVPVVYAVSSSTVDYVYVAIEFPHGLVNVDSNGNIIGDSVTFAFYSKPASSGTWTQVSGNVTISDKSSSPAVVQYRIARPSGAAGAVWDIRVRRLTQDNETSVRKNAILVFTVTEVQAINLSYNGVAICGVSINAQNLGGLSNSIPTFGFLVQNTGITIPSNYNPSKTLIGYNSGNYTTYNPFTGTWDGTFTTGVTDDPAWVLYDMLTNPQYGCHIYGITAANVDKYSFYNASVFNNGLVPDGFGGYEKRFTFNAPIQARKDVLQSLQDVAGMMNGALGEVNGLITLFQDRPQNSQYVINKSNVMPDASNRYFIYQSTEASHRTTAINCTWTNNGDLRYLPTVTSVYDSTGLSRYGYIPMDLAAFGATTEGQAIRAAKWWLYTDQNFTDHVKFKRGTEGFNMALYDVFDLYDEDYTRQAGAGTIISATTNTVTFDKPIVVSGSSPSVSVRLQDGVTYENHAITNGAGTYTTVTISGTWSTIPTQYCPYVVFSAISPRTFRVVDLSLDTNTKETTVTALLYNKNNYAYIETGYTGTSPVYTQPTLNTVGNVTSPSFTPTQYINPTNNQLQYGLIIQWVAPTGPQVSKYQIKWRKDNGQYNQTAQFTGNTYELTNIVDGTYDFIIYALNVANTSSSGTAASYTFSTTGGGSSTTVSNVTTLEIVGGGTTWTGHDCVFHWANPAANQGLLKDFQVEIINSVTSTIMRTITVPAVPGGSFQSYTYPYSLNVADGGPYRTIEVKVISRDSSNNVSSGVLATFTNPAPVTPANLNIAGGYATNVITYSAPSVSDFVGSLMWRDVSSGFTPSAANLIHIGPDVSYTDSVGGAPTTYYYKVASYDSFYDPVGDSYAGTGLNISAATSSTSLSITTTNTYRITGVTFTPNSPSSNQVSWTSGSALKTGGGGANPIGTSWTISAGNATWTAGTTMYIYFNEGFSTFATTTTDTSAVSASGVVVATYHGGTALIIGDGNAFTDGAYLIAGSVVASKLSVATLSAISANVGTLTAGTISNNSGTNYINLSATGSSYFIDVPPAFSVTASGVMTLYQANVVDTLNIAGNAVTIISANAYPGGTNLPFNTNITVCTLTPMTLSYAAPVLLTYENTGISVLIPASGNGYNVENATGISCTIRRNGTIIKQFPFVDRSTTNLVFNNRGPFTRTAGPNSFSMVDNPGVGTFTYTVVVNVGYYTNGQGGTPYAGQTLAIAQDFLLTGIVAKR